MQSMGLSDMSDSDFFHSNGWTFHARRLWEMHNQELDLLDKTLLANALSCLSHVELLMSVTNNHPRENTKQLINGFQSVVDDAFLTLNIAA